MPNVNEEITIVIMSLLLLISSCIMLTTLLAKERKNVKSHDFITFIVYDKFKDFKHTYFKVDDSKKYG